MSPLHSDGISSNKTLSGDNEKINLSEPQELPKEALKSQKTSKESMESSSSSSISREQHANNEPKVDNRDDDEQEHEQISSNPDCMTSNVSTQSTKEELKVDTENESKEKKIEHQTISSPVASTLTRTSLSSFWEVGLRRKATPFALKSWTALSLTLDGRDKITKVFQYVSRFLGWWLAGSHKYHSKRFTSLYKSLSTSRKAFRLGRSFIEIEKLRSMGLMGLLMWHLKQSLMMDDDDDDGHDDDDDGDRKQHVKTPRPKTFVRRVSSNIGWGPMTQVDTPSQQEIKRSYNRSLSHTFRRMYRPLLSQMSSQLSQSTGSSDKPSTELWKAIGSAMKMLGLFGFWAGDNLNFLCGSGAFDNYRVSDKERVAERKTRQTLAGIRANQSYFFGSLAGLVVNWFSYLTFCRSKLRPATLRVKEAADRSSLSYEEQSVEVLKKLQEKQFSLFLAFLKSCCDVMVFSNNPGIDLHKKYRGKKNHEGFHCLCGLISAGTVLYNNFPDSK